jgi:hypothetical protein
MIHPSANVARMRDGGEDRVVWTAVGGPTTPHDHDVAVVYEKIFPQAIEPSL